jgi:hypothetical protein
MTSPPDDKSIQAQGGRARAKKLTRERRGEIARKAAEARWDKDGLATSLAAHYGAPDRPLRIGPIEIPCYVLSDGTRVLAQRGLQSGIGLSESGGTGGERRIAAFMARLAQKGIDVRGLVARTNSPIRFIPPHGGNPADGYEATILPDICAVIIDADQKGKLDGRLKRLAERAAVLQHGFATVGIIAMVDEATGYQEIRARDALAKILEAFVAKELRRWVKTFPTEFYKQLFRLRNLPYSGEVKRPQYIGHLTNDLVYARLAPGVLDELNRVTGRDAKGRLKHHLHRRLTDDLGHPKLLEHLASLTALMKASESWDQFKKMVDRALPKYKDLPLFNGLDDGGIPL